MTDGPPVTIIDPRARPAPPSAPRRSWTASERALALVTAAVLLVGLASARHLRAGTPGGLSAEILAHNVVLGSPSVVQLEVVLSGDQFLGVRAVRPDAGWDVAGRVPPTLGPGMMLRLAHPVVCGARLPLRIRLDTDDGRSLPVRLRARPADRALSLCDPVVGPEAVRVVTSTLTRGIRTSVRLGLVDVATEPVTLSAVSFPGFSFAATRPMPLLLAGRDRSRVLSLVELPVSHLDLVASVTGCASAQRALEKAASTRTPDLLGAVVDGRPATLVVHGLEAYLDLQWQATCVP